MKGTSGTKSARRYAKAVYLIAREKGQETLWSRELEKADSLFSLPETSRVMTHPKLGTPEKWKIFETLTGEKGVGFQKETLPLLKLLLQNQKIHLLTAIRQEFQRLWESQQGILTVLLTTAVSLTPEEKEALRRSLIRSLGKEVHLMDSVEPEILGGAILQIEDRIIDGSLRSKLRQMRETLVA